MQQAQIGLTKNHRNEGLATGEVTMSCAIRMPASGNGLPTNGIKCMGLPGQASSEQKFT